MIKVHKCPCKQKEHKIDTSFLKYQMLDQFISELGYYIPVFAFGNHYNVPRIYIAMHGLKAQELPDLGFEMIPNLSKR